MCQETQWRKRTTSRLWHTTLFPRLNSCIVASSSCHSRKHGLISLKSFAKHVCHYDVPCKTIKHEQRKKTWNQQKQYQWERNQIYIYIYICINMCIYIYIYKVMCHLASKSFAYYTCMTPMSSVYHLQSSRTGVGMLSRGSPLAFSKRCCNACGLSALYPLIESSPKDNLTESGSW